MLIYVEERSRMLKNVERCTMMFKNVTISWKSRLHDYTFDLSTLLSRLSFFVYRLSFFRLKLHYKYD
jgi:hypothetical protein